MIPLQPPRYEVLNARPTLGQSIREFTLIEYGTWAAVTAAGAAGGFAFGECHPLGSREGRGGVRGVLGRGAVTHRRALPRRLHGRGAGA